MEELSEKINNLTNTVNRIEEMMLEDRKNKKENAIVQKEISKQATVKRITLLEKHRDEKACELRDEDDMEYKRELQQDIDNYNVKIAELKEKNF